MDQNRELLKDQTDQDLLITHIFNAPRELVFKAWTNPEQLKRWYAPTNCTIEFKHIDVREGGTFHSCIKNPNYDDCWTKGVYLEVNAPSKLVYSLDNTDEFGNDVLTTQHLDWPLKTIVTVTFEDFDGKTKLTLHQNAPEKVAKQTGAYPSWIEMLNHLEADILS
jgi:uncharacterized protein YndB with AHSA1/START domain